MPSHAHLPLPCAIAPTVARAGYISEADLRRVLRSYGRAGSSGDELHSMLEGAAGSDREGQRVGYGDYIRLMSHTVKRSLRRGEDVFRSGDPVTHF